MNKPRNILFLMDDQHRPDVLGYTGNKIVRTPTLDRLAQDAAIFENAYAPSPVCVPGRMCMMSGQLPKTCGARVYGDDIPAGYMTFSRTLAHRGYNTAVAGKLHHMGCDQMQGWTQRMGWHDMHVHDEYLEERDKKAFEQLKPTQASWDIKKEIERAGTQRSPYATNDAYSVQGALNFIEEYFNAPFYDRPRKDTPLLLKVSLQQPHYPYTTDEERFNYYLNRVELFENKVDGIHPALDDFCHNPDVSERDIRRALAAYYGMVEQVDAHFQQVLDALHRVGENIDEWLIVFTSDHGDMMGEHNNWWKLKFYEASVKVPLLIRCPALFEGSRIRENVNLCDLFATFCNVTDTPIPEGLDSRDLMPLMQGNSENWNDESISQIYHDYLMIKQGSLKYLWFGKDSPEVLFDLDKDPGETRNWIDDPAYAEHLPKFRKRAESLGYGQNPDPHYKNAGYHTS